MADSPFFEDEADKKPADELKSYLLPKKEGTVAPLHEADKKSSETDRLAAADLIRKKLDAIYRGDSVEPSAKEEIAEVETIKPHSKHQEFMHKLAESGKDLAAIQTAWHHYYVTLPDSEKREVWEEFYASNAVGSKYHQQPHPKPATEVVVGTMSLPTVSPGQPKPKLLAVHTAPVRSRAKPKPKTIKRKIVHHVTAGGKLKAKHHFQSLLFGLGMGFLVIFIFLFGFFNEIIITPFIQPSRQADATPLILSADSVAPTPNPEVIIPKINVEIPVNYTETSTDENVIENDLQSGVVHYPTTVLPGQNGNTAFFGHSSNNIFAKGKYKFAFVLLHTMVPGDTFYLTYQSKVYVYKVISKSIVKPTDVSVLGPVAGQTATATLITCDPPGTSLNRLILVGEQVSPDPATNGQSTPVPAPTTATPATLPGNGPTLWTRFWRWVF